MEITNTCASLLSFAIQTKSGNVFIRTDESDWMKVVNVSEGFGGVVVVETDSSHFFTLPEITDWKF